MLYSNHALFRTKILLITELAEMSDCEGFLEVKVDICEILMVICLFFEIISKYRQV